MNPTASTRIAAAIHRRYGETVDVAEDLPGRDALAVMNERAVCRRYRADPVPPALLRLLCATALASPTKSDLQQASVVRVEPGDGPGGDRRALPRLAVDRGRAGVPGLLRRRLPPAARVRAARARVPERAPRRVLQRRGRRRDRALDVRPGGGARRLGSCPISEIRNHAAAVAERLALPDWVFPIAGLTLGWPEAHEPLSPRLALSATVHDGRYDAARVDRELDGYDERRIRERPYRRQRLTERFGTAERYGWTEDKARQYSEPQRADFGAFVREKRYRLE